MREILFRGKRIDNGEWAEGDLIKIKDYFGDIIVRIHQIEGNGTWREYDIDPETVCQYTGLTDKNDRKIFEGDILQLGEESGTAKVCFENAEFVLKGITHGMFCASLKDVRKYCEAICNIFDNPELCR